MKSMNTPSEKLLPLLESTIRAQRETRAQIIKLGLPIDSDRVKNAFWLWDKTDVDTLVREGILSKRIEKEKEKI